MFNQKMSYTIPSIDDKIDNKVHNSVDKNYEIGKFKQQYYVNRHCKTRTSKNGDKVLVLQYKRTKFKLNLTNTLM